MTPDHRPKLSYKAKERKRWQPTRPHLIPNARVRVNSTTALHPPLSPPTPSLLTYLAQQRAGSMLSLACLHKACFYEDFDLTWCQCCLNPSNKTEPAAKKGQEQ